MLTGGGGLVQYVSSKEKSALRLKNYVFQNIRLEFSKL